VIRILRKDNLETAPERIAKMKIRREITVADSPASVQEKVADFLAKKGWKTDSRAKGDGTLLFAQKGGWTRFGVYIVHTSILVILLGAVIGSSTFAQKVLHKPGYAFKGSIMIPESRQTDSIFAFQTGKKIDLGFTVRCNYFTIEYYPNGMPKTYLSKISILENGKPVTLKDGKDIHYLKVNTPLTYKGITFYQSSYQPYSDFLVTLKDPRDPAEQTSIIPAGKQVDEIVSLLDLPRTLVQLTVGEDFPGQGRSLLPLLQSDSPEWENEAFAEMQGQRFAYQQRVLCQQCQWHWY